MKSWRIVAVLLLILVLAGSMACRPFGGGEGEEVAQQPDRVVRGDLVVSVSGAGNIDVSNEAELTFGVGGKIDKIYVKEGDSVSKGDVQARLDTGALELALTQAQVALTKQQVAVTQAQLGVTQAQLAVTQAEVALETAKFNLDRMADVAEARDDIEDAEYELKVAQAKWKEAIRWGDDYIINYWKNEVVIAQVKLAQAQLDLAEILADPDYASLVVDEVVIKQLQVKAAEQSLEAARQSLEQAQQSVEVAKQSLEQDRQSVEQAQKQLDEATIIVPFGGTIVEVNASEGDTVLATKTIIRLIDLTSMELKVDIDEIDIPVVKPGQRAIIDVDALPDFQFEGEVTSIGLLPTVEAGIVSYEVTIGLDVSDDSGLRVGMSATADIIIDKRSNVLLVPGRAVTQDNQGNSVVMVMIGEQIQPRVVVLGISDGIQTEIVEGLQEGDVVVLGTQAKPQSSGGGLFFGGHD